MERRQSAPEEAAEFCRCQANRDVVAGVTGLETGIDIVHVVGTNPRAIRKNRPFEARPASGANDGGCIATVGESKVAHRADRFFLVSSERAAQQIEQVYLRPFNRA